MATVLVVTSSVLGSSRTLESYGFLGKPYFYLVCEMRMLMT